MKIHNSYIQALDKQSKDGRIVAVKKIKLGSRFVARITPIISIFSTYIMFDM